MTNDIHDVGKGCPPQILVVDNQLDQIATLLHELAHEGLSVLTADSRPRAMEVLASSVVDVALVDVNLRDPDEKGNRDGIFLADDMATIAPETQVIFISRPVYLDVQSLLHMFNPDPNLANCRLGAAYVDKADTEAVVEMCLSILGAKNDVEWPAPIFADEASWRSVRKDLDAKVSGVIKERGRGLVDGERQCLQILRRLASHELMPLKQIAIEHLGRGRSRTMVLTMAAKYSPTDVQHLSVVKLGDREIVQGERSNYLKWVPSFVQSVAYPAMTGAAASRQLAGIGYSMLGESNEPAQTFVDRFWSLPEKKVFQILDSVFHSLLVPKQAPTEKRGRNIRNEYQTRFRRLADSAKLEADLTPLCTHCGIKVSQDSWAIAVGKRLRKVHRPTDLIESHFFNPYWVSVVHGDLHGENVIVLSDEVVSDDMRAFLIDFAHIGEHHVFLDYVVMEISVRFHLLSRFLRSVEMSQVDELMSRWVEIEEWFAEGDTTKSEDPPWDISAPNDPLAILARVVMWLRSNAWLHGFNDSYHNYYGAIGMTALTSPFLPDESGDRVRYAVRKALLSCAAFSLDRVHRDAATNPRRTPWRDAAAAGAKRVDLFLANLLEANRSRISRAAKGELQAFCRRVSPEGQRIAAGPASMHCDLLRADMPLLGQALKKYGNLDSPHSDLETSEYRALTDAFVAANLFAQVDSADPLAHLQSKFNDWLATTRKGKHEP